MQSGRRGSMQAKPTNLSGYFRPPRRSTSSSPSMPGGIAVAQREDDRLVDIGHRRVERVGIGLVLHGAGTDALKLLVIERQDVLVLPDVDVAIDDALRHGPDP